MVTAVTTVLDKTTIGAAAANIFPFSRSNSIDRNTFSLDFICSRICSTACYIQIIIIAHRNQFYSNNVNNRLRRRLDEYSRERARFSQVCVHVYIYLDRLFRGAYDRTGRIHVYPYSISYCSLKRYIFSVSPGFLLREAEKILTAHFPRNTGALRLP